MSRVSPNENRSSAVWRITRRRAPISGTMPATAGWFPIPCRRGPASGASERNSPTEVRTTTSQIKLFPGYVPYRTVQLFALMNQTFAMKQQTLASRPQFRLAPALNQQVTTMRSARFIDHHRPGTSRVVSCQYNNNAASRTYIYYPSNGCRKPLRIRLSRWERGVGWDALTIMY